MCLQVSKRAGSDRAAECCCQDKAIRMAVLGHWESAIKEVEITDVCNVVSNVR